jgi:molecular chaperone DnaK
VGIDLGTTNSAVAFVEGGDPQIIPNDRGGRITPSTVAFTDANEVLVGESAKNQAVVNASRTIVSVKRYMGSDRVFTVGQDAYSPEQVSAFILERLKACAEDFLGEEVTDAVITVPANFSELERRATQEAGRLAGLRVRRILNEPTAAALAYAIRAEGNVLVYDLGGGTFDVTFLQKRGNTYDVRSTRGESHLGGIDFDRLLLENVLQAFEQESDVDIRGDAVLLQQLTEQVERAKIELSSRQEALVALPFVRSAHKPVHLSYTITRDELESLIEPLIQRTMDLTLGALEDAGVAASEVDSLILSGGSSRIPLVRQRLAREIPVAPQSRINPEEVVALGAAAQAYLFSGESSDVVLRDVMGTALGVEIDGGRFVDVLPRNAHLPVEAGRVFTTVADSQSAVEIHVLQGDSQVAGENTSLGRFLLTGIRDGRKGEPRIHVRFSVDADGILHVHAEDADTGAAQRVTLTTSGSDAPSEDGDFVTLKNRVSSLLGRVSGLVEAQTAGGSGSGSAYLDKSFRREIDSVVKSSKQALVKGDPLVLRESQLALETIVGELNAVLQEAQDERA